MSPESGQWSDDQMMEALSQGVEADRSAETAEFEQANGIQGTPAGDPQSPSQGAVQPAEPVAPVEQNTGLFDGTPINPDELPAELQPLAKQLQAAFTQKTQEVAEQRRQFEALGAIDDVQQAIELASRINDPANWLQLHQELSQAMQQYGIAPVPPAPGVEPVAPETAAPALDLSGIEDPELAPFVQALQATQAELQQLKSERQQEQANAAAEFQRQAFLGELQRQENAIRGAHPDWGDDKIEAVYEMSSFYGGNLAQAATRLESLLHAERELYLAQKSGALQETGAIAPPRAAGAQTHRVNEPETIRDAEAEALEFFTQRVATLSE